MPVNSHVTLISLNPLSVNFDEKNVLISKEIYEIFEIPFPIIIAISATILLFLYCQIYKYESVDWFNKANFGTCCNPIDLYKQLDHVMNRDCNGKVVKSTFKILGCWSNRLPRRQFFTSDCKKNQQGFFIQENNNL